MGGVDTERLEVLDGGRTKQVASHPRHHEHLRTTETSGDRLIRALASESQLEFLPEDGFPGLGELVGKRCEINVGTSNHRNARAPGHSFLQRTLRPPSLFGARDRVNGDGVPCAPANASSSAMTSTRDGPCEVFCYSCLPRRSRLMPRIVRCALIQASNALSTERPLAQIRKAMIDKHLKLIEQAARKKTQVLCLQELFYGPYFCAEQNARWYELTERVPDGPTTRLMQKIAAKHRMVI